MSIFVWEYVYDSQQIVLAMIKLKVKLLSYSKSCSYFIWDLQNYTSSVKGFADKVLLLRDLANFANLKIFRLIQFYREDFYWGKSSWPPRSEAGHYSQQLPYSVNNFWFSQKFNMRSLKKKRSLISFAQVSGFSLEAGKGRMKKKAISPSTVVILRKNEISATAKSIIRFGDFTAAQYLLHCLQHW